MTPQKIVPHLWYDHEAKEAAAFYTGIFPNSQVFHSTTLQNTPSGDADIVSFKLWDYEFMSLSGGPLFKFNPSISFMVNFDPAKDRMAQTRFDEIWEQLKAGGHELMPLDEYPFSQHYGWLVDKYGLSWQLILTNPDGEPRPPIIPSLMFANKMAGKALEATDYYLKVFKNTKRGTVAKYPAGMEPDKEGTTMFTDYLLENQWFAAVDSAQEHQFDFNEAISLMVKCDDQAEIDYYWEKLSADSKAEQCGWLKDKYGVSWQITPTLMTKIMREGSREQIDRVTQTFLPMKKLDLAKIKQAYQG